MRTGLCPSEQWAIKAHPVMFCVLKNFSQVPEKFASSTEHLVVEVKCSLQPAGVDSGRSVDLLICRVLKGIKLAPRFYQM